MNNVARVKLTFINRPNGTFAHNKLSLITIQEGQGSDFHKDGYDPISYEAK